MASIKDGSRKLSGQDGCCRLLTGIMATGVVAAVGVLGFGLSQALASGAIPSQDPEPTTTDTSNSTSSTEPAPEPVPDDPLPTPDPAPSQTVKPDPAPRTSQPRTQVRDTPQTPDTQVAPPSKETLEPLTTQPNYPARAAEPVQEPRLRQRPAKHPARAAPHKTSAPKAATAEERTSTRVKAIGGTVTMAAESAYDDAQRTATAAGLVLAVLAVGVVFVYRVRDRLKR